MPIIGIVSRGDKKAYHGVFMVNYDWSMDYQNELDLL
jgi:hypothetical protein